LKNGIFTYLACLLAHQDILMLSMSSKCAHRSSGLSGILFCPKICSSCRAVTKKPSGHHFLPQRVCFECTFAVYGSSAKALLPTQKVPWKSTHNSGHYMDQATGCIPLKELGDNGPLAI
jgi:hypothetical protein